MPKTTQVPINTQELSTTFDKALAAWVATCTSTGSDQALHLQQHVTYLHQHLAALDWQLGEAEFAQAKQRATSIINK